MRGIESQHARQDRASRPRLPITPPILREMKGVWERDSSNFDHIMIWAACTLCFFGFLRSGEITVPADNGYDPGAHVSFTDVAIDDRSNPKLMRIRIKASKRTPSAKESIYLWDAQETTYALSQQCWPTWQSEGRDQVHFFAWFLLGTGRMPHPVDGAMGVTLCHCRAAGETRLTSFY